MFYAQFKEGLGQAERTLGRIYDGYNMLRTVTILRFFENPHPALSRMERGTKALIRAHFENNQSKQQDNPLIRRKDNG